MNVFTISELEQFSGIKAHTIRIWEKRYDALKPGRSEGNTRYYDSLQLRRLLNIQSLKNSGHKVSDLCRMPDEKIFKLLEGQLKSQTDLSNPNEYYLSQMLVAGINYDQPYFEKLFANCLLRHSIKETYLQVIYPLLVRLGIMWTMNSIPPSQEHFITNILRQKLFAAIDSLPAEKSSRNSWLLFLPENEYHEIGLLFASYLIRLAGKKVIYLGPDVPFESLKNAVDETQAANLLFFHVHNNKPEESQSYLNLLYKTFKKQKIHIAANPQIINQLKSGKEIHWIQSVSQLEKLLNS